MTSPTTSLFHLAIPPSPDDDLDDPRDLNVLAIHSYDIPPVNNCLSLATLHELLPSTHRTPRPHDIAQSPRQRALERTSPPFRDCLTSSTRPRPQPNPTNPRAPQPVPYEQPPEQPPAPRAPKTTQQPPVPRPKDGTDTNASAGADAAAPLHEAPNDLPILVPLPHDTHAPLDHRLGAAPGPRVVRAGECAARKGDCCGGAG